MADHVDTTAPPLDTPAPVTSGVHPANPVAYLKAVVGAVLAGLGVLYVALNDGTITAQEYVEIAQATLIAGAGVYGIPNAAVRTR